LKINIFVLQNCNLETFNNLKINILTSCLFMQIINQLIIIYFYIRFTFQI
jgi:hypothetical protein